MQSTLPSFKVIVCLANSYRLGGHCIAGKEMLPRSVGGWIRPVSTRKSCELTTAECNYPDHTAPRLLDVLRVPTMLAMPQLHQTENIVVDHGRPWEKLGVYTLHGLATIADHPESLWTNSDHTAHGEFNCISPEEARLWSHSLLLIHAPSFTIKLVDARDGKRAHFGCFTYNGARYSIRITDPSVFVDCIALAPGEHPRGEAFLCVSLSHVFEGDKRCHKLIAGVIQPKES